MVRKLMVITLFALLAAPAAVFASGDAGKCATKYPVVLCHGMAMQGKMFNIVDYFWGVEGAVEDEGGEIYAVSVNAMDSTQNKAVQFKKQLLEIIAVSKAQKVNIIGHSHGTLYTRLAMSNMDCAKYVASHTSLCGPHRGSVVADLVVGLLPNSAQYLIGSVLDLAYQLIMGDTNPNSIQNAYSLTRDYMKNTFNKTVPNVSGIYYQSWATQKTGLTADVVMEPTWAIMSLLEGDSDGVVSVESAKWGTFRGIQKGSWWAGGVSHLNATGQFAGITPGFDHKGWYVDMIADLKGKGY
jgi:triacylglycerol lipase